MVAGPAPAMLTPRTSTNRQPVRRAGFIGRGDCSNPRWPGEIWSRPTPRLGAGGPHPLVSRLHGSRGSASARSICWRVAMVEVPEGLIQALEDVATRLRIESVRATTAAGSGHPTSAASAADLVAALFFAVMR